MLLQISDYIPELKDKYFISDSGELFTDYGKVQLKDCIKNDYVRNGLILKNGKSKHFARHRLVMMCFDPIDNPEEMQVNHIDGNKLNNSLENLE